MGWLSVAVYEPQSVDILKLFLAQSTQPEQFVCDFEPFVKWVLAKGIKGLVEEFNTELRKYTGVCTERKAFEANKSKNRYCNVLCWDKSRVAITDGKENDYVHANFVRGDPLVKPDFIATQGPTAGTVVDFWRMIEFTGAQCIIMLCNFMENGKKKCETYFPKNIKNIMNFGDIKINYVGECVLDNDNELVRTDLLLTNGKGNQREIRHYHYRAWPDRHTPKSCRTVLRLLTYVRMYSLAVVHCSAGIGRTGTLLATEMALQSMVVKHRVNLLEVTKKLRDQRCSAIQVELQYATVALLVGEHAMATGIIKEKTHPELVKEWVKLKAEFKAIVPPQGAELSKYPKKEDNGPVPPKDTKYSLPQVGIIQKLGCSKEAVKDLFHK